MTPTKPALTPYGSTRKKNIDGDVDRVAPKVMAAQHIPGAAIIVVEGDHVVFIKGYGGVDPRTTRFRIGSVTDRGVAVAQGLNGNERVVASAGAFLNPGERVRPERARVAAR